MNNQKMIAMRDAFGDALLALATRYPEMVVLDADVSSSTQTVRFGNKYPERFFNVGVAEANMVDIAGGMAMCGLRPVVSTFAVFLSLKATEQIANNICYNNLPVILVGGYAGMSDSFDGASHQSVNDIAIMRSMPNMTVLVPSDAMETEYCLRQAMKLKNPVYIRICRNPGPVLFHPEEISDINKIAIIRKGSDLTIAACGVLLATAIEAATELENEGISCEVLNVSTIKPLDNGTLIKSARKTGHILTIEEHSIIGGLGGAVSELLGQQMSVQIHRIGLNDTFGETGPYEELLEKYYLSKKHIVKKVRKILQANDQ